jgi:hypothetical protein
MQGDDSNVKNIASEAQFVVNPELAQFCNALCSICGFVEQDTLILRRYAGLSDFLDRIEMSEYAQ